MTSRRRATIAITLGVLAWCAGWAIPSLATGRVVYALVGPVSLVAAALIGGAAELTSRWIERGDE